MVRICLVGDYNPHIVAHQAIPEALTIAAGGKFELRPEWVGTDQIGEADLSGYDGFWCVPASPYRCAEGAFTAIRVARESGRPFLGTCGGFQHAVIEYARNVLGIPNADHEETNPAGPQLFISRLACSLVEADENHGLVPGSRLVEIYGEEEIRETYHCNFGLNPHRSASLFAANGFRAGAIGENGEVRAIELQSHPFFFATLFQPERSALRSEVHPLIQSFVEHSARRRSSSPL